MKIVIVTGASRGIGRSVARQCACAGYAVIGTYRSGRAEADSLVDAITDEGGEVAFVPLDVANSDSIAAFASSVQAIVESRWGRGTIDGLVNNAGHGAFAPIGTVSEEAFDALYRVHLKGPFFLTQALLPMLAEGAAIVNISSATTRVATTGVAPYAAFKGGIEVLTRYMAKEFGPRKIRANAIAPGAIRTDLAGGIPADFENQLARETALGRIGEVDDVGRAIVALLGEDWGWANAQTIELSGGYMV